MLATVIPDPAALPVAPSLVFAVAAGLIAHGFPGGA